MPYSEERCIMCPYYVDNICELEPEKGPVQDPFPLYYCRGQLRPESYLECPVYKSKGDKKKNG